MTNRRRISRRKFMAGIAGAAAGGFGYTRLVEPTWLSVGRHEVRLAAKADLPAIRVLHLSDLHASNVVSLDFIRSAIRSGLGLKPDLICLTGDFITARYEQTEAYAEVLSALSKAAPTFATLGNHDGGRWAAGYGGFSDTASVRAVLAASGITLLHNSSRTVELKGGALQVAGLGDAWAGECQPDQVLPRLTDASPVLLLSHNPDTKEMLRPYRWDLMLCGHTHGGQMRLPLIGTPFAPVRDKRYVQGLHLWEDRWLHVTRGVGNLHGARFNCRPEISLLTLT